MDLILWRHAEAEDAQPGQVDADRRLTPRGEKQAARMAAWLDRQLPDATRIVSSPAARCEQTAMALGRRYKTRPELAQGEPFEHIARLAGWPDATQPVLVVGHQPALGEAIAALLGMSGEHCAVRKAGVWWLRARDREDGAAVVLRSVQSPELL